MEKFPVIPVALLFEGTVSATIILNQNVDVLKRDFY